MSKLAWIAQCFYKLQYGFHFFRFPNFLFSLNVMAFNKPINKSYRCIVFDG